MSARLHTRNRLGWSFTWMTTSWPHIAEAREQLKMVVLDPTTAQDDVDRFRSADATSEGGGTVGTTFRMVLGRTLVYP